MTTIRFQFTGEPEEAAVYELLIDAFEAENPDIRVQPRRSAARPTTSPSSSPRSPVTRLPTSSSSTSASTRSSCTRDAIEPIGPRLEELGVDLGDYYDQPIEAFTFDGELQCLPQNVSSLVVYWNRILFERAGVAPPTDGWTWDEFRQAASR